MLQRCSRWRWDWPLYILLVILIYRGMQCVLCVNQMFFMYNLYLQKSKWLQLTDKCSNIQKVSTVTLLPVKLFLSKKKSRHCHCLIFIILILSFYIIIILQKKEVHQNTLYFYPHPHPWLSFMFKWFMFPWMCFGRCDHETSDQAVITQ